MVININILDTQQLSTSLNKRISTPVIFVIVLNVICKGIQTCDIHHVKRHIKHTGLPVNMLWHFAKLSLVNLNK